MLCLTYGSGVASAVCSSIVGFTVSERAAGAVEDHSTFEDVTREQRLNELHNVLPLQAVLLCQRHALGNHLNYAVPKQPCSEQILSG